jgi:putative phosphoesterase
VQPVPVVSTRSAGARRVLILSDTHGSLHPSVAALACDCDIAVHAGDIGDLGVLEALRPRLRRVIAVLGNNDTPARWPPGQGAAAARLPACVQLRLNGGMLVVEHGHRAGSVAGRHRTLRERYPQARLVVYGHSHRLCRDVDEMPWVVNPGAAGRTRTFGGASCLVLRIEGQQWDIETHRFRLETGRRQTG